MSRSKPILAAMALALTGVVSGFGPLRTTPLAAQDVRPLAPIREPAPPETPAEPGETPRTEPDFVPLPEAASRAEAASRDRVKVTAVLPAAWNDVVSLYQPFWVDVMPARAFGLQRWTGYFAGAGFAPTVSAHPFFSPWGMMAYDGWLFDRYRALWSSARPPDRGVEAAAWLHRGDRAMAAGLADEASTSYRRVTQVAPELPLGYLGLGAALAELGHDAAAAQAFRQSLDRYPGWLGMAIDWDRLYGADRLVQVQASTETRALGGSAESRFVAAVLHLFGERPDRGRELLDGLAGDPHAAFLLARGPR